MSNPKMKSKAEISESIIELVGPDTTGLDPFAKHTAQRTLAWVLGRYGDAPLSIALQGGKPLRTPSEPEEPAEPQEPAEPTA